MVLCCDIDKDLVEEEAVILDVMSRCLALAAGVVFISSQPADT